MYVSVFFFRYHGKMNIIQMPNRHGRMVEGKEFRER